MLMKMIKTYQELIQKSNFIDRLNYLKTYNTIGDETFGHLRYLNQRFYTSSKWKKTRRNLIIRDNGCDLGVEGYEIPDGVKIVIHHIQPITIDDIINQNPTIYDMNNLITTTYDTHKKIHYNKHMDDFTIITERHPDDTTLWKGGK